MGRTAAVRDYGGVSASDRRAERRRKLLDAGRTLWGEGGITEVSLRGVCAEAGLIPRYFYEQFPDRDALLVAIADQVRDQLVAVLLTVGLGEPGDVADKLRAALKAFLDLIAEDPHIHRIFTDVLTGTGPLAERRRHALDMITGLVLEYGPGLIHFAPPSQDEMRRTASFIVGGVNQLIDTWLNDPRETTAELAQACTDLSLAIVRLYAPNTTP